MTGYFSQPLWQKNTASWHRFSGREGAWLFLSPHLSVLHISLVATITNKVCNKKYLFFTLKWSVKVNQHYQRDIKVSQHECGSESGGPPGCLQYYTATSGKIASFNYPTTSTSVSSTGAYFNSFLPISKIIVSFHDFQQLICQTNYMTFVSEEHQVIWNLTFLESNTNV